MDGGSDVGLAGSSLPEHAGHATSEPLTRFKTPLPTVPNAISSPKASVPPLTVTAAPTCDGTQLQITYDPAGSGGAAGSFGIELAVWNHGQPCHLRGWPTLQRLRSDGSVLPAHEEQTTSTFAGSANPTAVILYRSCGEPWDVLRGSLL